MADPTPHRRIVEQVDDHAAGVRDLDSFRSPPDTNRAEHFLESDNLDPHGRSLDFVAAKANPPGAHNHQVAKDLLGEAPVLAGAPARDVTRGVGLHCGPPEVGPPLLWDLG